MSRWYALHIKNEILFWFLLLALIPLILLTGVNYFYQKNVYQQQALAFLNQTLNEKVYDVNQKMDHIGKEILLLSEIPTIKQALNIYNQSFLKHQEFSLNDDYYEKFFARILNENQLYDIFLINPSGDIVYSVKKEADLATNLKTGRYSNSNLAMTVQNAKALLSIEFSDFEFYPPSNEEAAFAAIPIYGNQQILGVIAVQMDKDRILNTLTDHKVLSKTGEFVAARKDESGNLIATINLKNSQQEGNQKFQFHNASKLPISKAVYGEKGSGISIDYRGKEVIAAWSYLPSLRWGLVAKIDMEEVLKPIAKLRFYSILVLFFVGIGILIAILTSIRRIVRPIEQLTEGVQQFSNGSMETQVEIDVHNEIGDLSKNFNEMAKSLKLSQETVQKYTHELEHQVESRTHELENAKQELEQANQEMQSFMEIIDEHIITSTTDTRGRILKASQAFCNITGYSKEELIGKSHNLIRHPDMPSEIYKDLWQTITKGNIWRGEIKNQRKDGSYYWVSSMITPILNEQGEISGYTSIREDITDKKKVEELSITDQLTKLFNRHRIEEVFASEIERAFRYQRTFSLVILDIDHFKNINDNYGHDMGDSVLIDIAKIMQRETRKSDLVGRWGGEEFIIIMPETSMKDALEAIEKLRIEIEHYPFKVGQVTASFGLTDYQDGDTQKTLLKRADEALYQAKENGRNQVFSAAHS